MSISRSLARLALLALAATSPLVATASAQQAGTPKGAPLAADQLVVPGAAGVVQRPGAEQKSSATADDPLVIPGGAGVHRSSAAPPPAAFSSGQQNDYPTIARADYVFACMQVNGQTRDVLEKCSCSIDVIASILPFVEYEEAETIMSVRQRGGKALGIWEYGPAKEKVKAMKRAQVEGELRCF